MATSTLGSGTLVLAGTTSGTTTVTATAVAGTTTLTLPAATDTLVGKATTDTLTNKTLTTPTISSLSSAAATSLTLQSAGTTAITIDTSQNVMVNTTTPIYNLAGRGLITINGSSAAALGFTVGAVDKGILIHTGTDIIMSNSVSGAITFQTNNTERARIDSSGNLLVGRTTTANTTVGSGLYASGIIASCQSASTNANTAYDLYSTGAAAYRFYVGMGGTVFATNTAITAISDQRLKENIRDLDDGLQKVMALQPRKFDWKEGKGADIKNARGFIAQEFEIVFPDMVEEWKDTPPEGEEPYKAVSANLIPTLVKAIQEQQALITQLTARITALEGA